MDDRKYQPVQPRHDQHIALIKPLEQLAELDAVGTGTGDLLAVDLRTSGSVQLCVLRSQRLAIG